jgi:hypothetical protein
MRVAATGRVAAAARVAAMNRIANIAARLPNSVYGDILRLGQRYPHFAVDFFAVDGGATKVASFIDQRDLTHLLTQATSNNMALIPTADAQYGGRLSAHFDGAAAAKYYVSNRPGAAWSFFVNGPFRAYSTVSFTDVGTSTQDLHSTLATSVAGDTLMRFATSGSFTHSLFRPGVAGLSTAINAAILNTPTLVQVGILGGSAQRYIKTSQVAMNTTPLAGTDQVATQPLSFGARSGGQLPIRARVRHIMLMFPALNASQSDLVEQYIQQDGGPAP